MSERVVFDTNVFISALLISTRKPRRALDVAIHGRVILLSVETAAELASVARREKLRRYVTMEQADRFIRDLLTYAEYTAVDRRISACRDQKDDKFLEVAVNGHADFIVTGDDDLLVLNPFEDIPILTPDGFLGRMK